MVSHTFEKGSVLKQPRLDGYRYTRTILEIIFTFFISTGMSYLLVFHNANHANASMVILLSVPHKYFCARKVTFVGPHISLL